MPIRAPSRLRISEFTQNFWVFLFYIADFWQTFWVIWENGSNWSNLRLKMNFFALGRLKNHKVPHLHPNSTMFMPLDRLQLKIYAFSGKFNVCSKRVLLSWIKIYRDFTLQTQIFTQKYRSWLRFYSEFLRKKLAVEASAITTPKKFIFCQHEQKRNNGRFNIFGTACFYKFSVALCIFLVCRCRWPDCLQE